MSAAAETVVPKARILNVTQEEYFADPCAVPSLSQSIAHTLVSQSPLHAWSKHPRLGNQEQREPTTALDDGTLIHKLLLGKGKQIRIVAADSYRTKAAQDVRDEAIEAGMLPVLVGKHDAAQKAADTLRSNLAQYGLRLDGESEVAVEWQEEGDHGPVTCRGMLDHLKLDAGLILDLKKTRSAHPRDCARHLTEYGYDIQRAAYVSAVSKLRPDLAGRIRFVFVFLELEAPHVVLPAELDGQARELGEARWSRAVHLWERCLRTNRWPGYTDNIVQLAPTPWALAQEIEDDRE